MMTLLPFSKRNTQVKSFVCNVTSSEWVFESDCLVYNVRLIVFYEVWLEHW